MPGLPNHDFASMTVRGFCEALAARSPTPGGGAAAGVCAAQAAALLAMAVEFSKGKKSFAGFESSADDMLTEIRILMDSALVGARNDSDAYGALSALWKKPEGDPERTAHWTAAVRGAIAAPDFLLALASDITGRCALIAGTNAKHLDSDLRVAADLAGCAARAAASNVRANVPFLASEADRAKVLASIDTRLASVAADLEAVERGLRRDG